MRKTYSMQPYFQDLKYMIYFYDVLIKRSAITKEGLFKDLEIPYMSYTRAVDFDSSAGRNVINKLNNYFNIKELDYSKQNQYEDTLNSLLYRFYYRGDDLNEFEPILLEYIEENNYLRPLFLLLLLLINLVSMKSPQVLIQEKQELFKELKQYKGTYFTSPFAEIFTIVEVLFSGKELIEFDKEIPFADNMRGLLYNVYSSNAYLSKKYDLCLYYARECKDYLLRDHNYKRIVLVNLTYFACLNMIGEYAKCMNESRCQLLHLIESKQPYGLIYSTELHYYTSCIGARDYNEIINTISNKEEINSSEYIFLLIAASHNKKLYIKYLEKYKSEAYRFNDKQNDYINLIINYISKKNRTLMREKLLNSQINIGLKDILIKFY